MFPAGAFFRRAAIAAASLATVAIAHAAPAPRYSITEIAAPAMTWIEVTAVNNRGDVAGYFRSPQPGVSFEAEQGFLWSDGTLAPLGFPTAIRNSRIFGMNDKGVLVGGVNGGNAFTWQDGAWRDLGFVGEGHSINKSGAIAGTTHADSDLMRTGQAFVTGPVEAVELGLLFRRFQFDRIVLCMTQPLFGHPLQSAATASGLPVAYFDWSRGGCQVRSGDLPLDPSLSAAVIVERLLPWLQGRQPA